MNVTAFLALEGTDIETGGARCNGAKHHPAAQASQATRMFDLGKMH
jgi:hypothetical protein